jgi:hypothetical protein
MRTVPHTISVMRDIIMTERKDTLKDFDDRLSHAEILDSMDPLPGRNRVREFIDEMTTVCLKYLCGEFSGDMIDPTFYNARNGANALETVIQNLREARAAPDDRSLATGTQDGGDDWLIGASCVGGGCARRRRRKKCKGTKKARKIETTSSVATSATIVREDMIGLKQEEETEKDECPICCQEMDVKGEEGDDSKNARELITLSKCAHTFHMCCMELWTRKCLSNGHVVNCPYCRSDTTEF